MMENNMGITLTPVSEENLALTIETAVAVFGERDRDGIEREFKASAGRASEKNAAQAELHIVNPHYFLATRDGHAAGVTGYYNIEGLPEYRGKGIGSELGRQSFERAALDNPDNFRIWTTLEPDYDDARRLYNKMGFVQEPYRPGAKDAASMIAVFSKSAREKDGVSLWQNAAYPIDCEHHVIPELNEQLGLNHSDHLPSAPLSCIPGALTGPKMSG